MASPQKDMERVNKVRHFAETELLTSTQICLLLDMSRSAVIGLCRRNKIELPGHRGTRRPYKPRALKSTAVIPVAPLEYIAEVRASRKPKPTCCWHQCRKPAVSIGKPWCELHSRRQFHCG